MPARFDRRAFLRSLQSEHASIEIPISDDKILEYLRAERGLQEGKAHKIGVELEAKPNMGNSAISHVVTVKLQFGLELGELERLRDF